MAKRLRVSAQTYKDDEPTGKLELLGDLTLESGQLTQSPSPGKADALSAFIASYRNYGVGPEQDDAAFFDALPARIGWAMGACEEVKD